MPDSTAIARTEPKPMDTLKRLFESARPSMEAVIPKHLNAEKLIKIALVAVSRNPKLLSCTPQSILQSVMTASQLGLDCGGALGSAHLVPFKKNYKDAEGQWRSRMEAQLIVGYRGLIDLARRSGEIQTIEAHPVYPGESFTIEFGLEPKLIHVPSLEAKKKEKVGDKSVSTAIAFYSVCHLKDGGRQVEMMSRADVDDIRSRSRSADDGPWVTDYDEMGRKTVVKRLCKYLPLSPEAQEAIIRDNETEFDAGQLEVMRDPEDDAPIEMPKRLSEAKAPGETPATPTAEAAAPKAEPAPKPPIPPELDAELLPPDDAYDDEQPEPEPRRSGKRK